MTIEKVNITPVKGDTTWAIHGECKGLTSLFFGELKEKEHARLQREAAAVAVCKQCPVILQCRQFARENRELGVWGGETEDERYFAGFLKNPDVVRRNKARETRSKLANTY